MVDTTLGGAKFFTNGNNQSIQPAEPRPVIVRVAGTDPRPRDPPGGLKQRRAGHAVGGTRVSPPRSGSDRRGALAVACDVPGGSTLTYEVTVLRLSGPGSGRAVQERRGMRAGGANTMTNGCAAIVAEE